ncbi:TetR/AcrR family transcriptional regulator [Chthonobacter rhizosphaerae]|uniref:TetR/AcrR family transcriptional regulator n=1 Tax=Chthonobacter rhizosphaerae TaxID=2735553 RepID=UPI0015EF31BA|nr:TetR/AcrR family transcriptional regulator [Chthonobacter rhizosphaerae]
MASKAEAQRARIVDAFVGRLATQPLSDIDLNDVAADAGVTLADVRQHFDGRLAILKAFVQRIDTAVLSGDDPEMRDEPGRERLFDVLMRRFDALAPYKEAVRSLSRSARGDAGTALALNGLVVRSMGFMLAAARISTAGSLGRLKAQGLAIAWARAVDTWVDDDDPGLAKTMMTLDRELSRGERYLDTADRIWAGLKSLDDRLSEWRRGGRSRPSRPATDDEVTSPGDGI